MKDINKFFIPGAAKFAKMTKHHSLADFRLLLSNSDEIHVDLFIANDNRWKIMSPRQKPKRFSGMIMPVQYLEMLSCLGRSQALTLLQRA